MSLHTLKKFWISCFLIMIFPVISCYGQMAKKSHDMSTHSSYMKEKMPLVSPGNAVFGAIQEAIDSLNANPNTNWSKVNVEALRQHLIDMYEFTMNVAVIKQNPLPNGNELIVKPSNQRAEVALNHVLTMHPRMLKKEAGWNMTYQKNGNKYTIKVTTQNPKEVEKIRALGYIGILAYGTHHQRHHWMIVNGINPMTKE